MSGEIGWRNGYRTFCVRVGGRGGSIWINLIFDILFLGFWRLYGCIFFGWGVFSYLASMI